MEVSSELLSEHSSELSLEVSAEVTQDQYEYTNGVLHLISGDFDADFFR